MAYQYKFSEEEVNELLGEDLSLAASLTTLINENGNIRAFFVRKLEQIQERAEDREDERDDWNSLQDRVDANEARYINQMYFGQ
jgi:hypothetical protein